MLSGPRVRTALLTASFLILGGAALVSCGDGTTPTTGGGSGDPTVEVTPLPSSGSDPEAAVASCDDYTTWREAQDALDADPQLDAVLDDDLDGVACNDLAQEEYDSAFEQGVDDACSFVWQDSPDGVLYYAP